MFKANQIGAELLAVANKNAAETIADKVSTKIEIAVTLSDANQLESAVKTYNFEFNTANGIKSVYQFQYGQ